jgi:hypothetical protein
MLIINFDCDQYVGFADAATFPKEFTVAPALAIPRALASAGLKQSDIDLWEINEVFVFPFYISRLYCIDIATVWCDV